MLTCFGLQDSCNGTGRGWHRPLPAQVRGTGRDGQRGAAETVLQSGEPREDREQPHTVVRDGRRQRLPRGGWAGFADM